MRRLTAIGIALATFFSVLLSVAPAASADDSASIYMPYGSLYVKSHRHTDPLRLHMHMVVKDTACNDEAVRGQFYVFDNDGYYVTANNHTNYDGCGTTKYFWDMYNLEALDFERSGTIRIILCKRNFGMTFGCSDDKYIGWNL